MKNFVHWFEIPVSDLERASRFYSEVFGVEIKQSSMGEWEMGFFPMGEKDDPGAAGALLKSDGYVPSHEGSLVYFTVSDLDLVMKKITESGGMELLSKKDIGEHGFIAQFEDSEGNRVGLHEAAK